jgi:MoxR-like ATPase
MQEHHVSVGGERHDLPQPFHVLATQNPIEQEGTYPLPEAQIDRFLLKLRIDYPSQEEELEIITRMGSARPPTAEPVITPDDVLRIQLLSAEVSVERSVMEYIVRLVSATRFPKQAGFSELAGLISYGASPRASLGLQAAARARALLSGQGFVTPDQVKDVAPDVLRHRIIRSFEAEAEEVGVEEIIETILGRVPVK